MFSDILCIINPFAIYTNDEAGNASQMYAYILMRSEGMSHNFFKICNNVEHLSNRLIKIRGDIK